MEELILREAHAHRAAPLLNAPAPWVLILEDDGPAARAAARLLRPYIRVVVGTLAEARP